MKKVKSNSKFEVTDEFLNAIETQQDKMVKSFLNVNPLAQLIPNTEGQELPYLRRSTGHRWSICQLLKRRISTKEFLQKAKSYGGGLRDISAVLSGGYSPTSKFYGVTFVTLSAT